MSRADHTGQGRVPHVDAAAGQGQMNVTVVQGQSRVNTDACQGEFLLCRILLCLPTAAEIWEKAGAYWERIEAEVWYVTIWVSKRDPTWPDPDAVKPWPSNRSYVMNGPYR